MVSAGPPMARAALILSCPWPGMSTTVSRGIERRELLNPPARTSISVSERLGSPTTLAPPSFVPFGRASEPITRMLLGTKGMGPAGSRALLAESGTLPCSICALIRKRTSERPSHAATATPRSLEDAAGVPGLAETLPEALLPLLAQPTDPANSGSGPRRRFSNTRRRDR